MNNCQICGQEMRPSTTTFDVVTDKAVYVVRNAPCLECEYCEEVIFEQDVSDRLFLLTSGRALPQRKPLTAWVYEWDDPVTVAPKTRSRNGTDNTWVIRAEINSLVTAPASSENE